jgi:sulfur-carrier protein
MNRNCSKWLYADELQMTPARRIRDRNPKRDGMLQFFACKDDLSHEPPDAPLPNAVALRAEPFFGVEAIAGG